VKSKAVYTLFVIFFILALITSARSDSVVILEHKENFTINRNTKEDYPLVILNGSVLGYNLSNGDVIQVSWSAKEDPSLVAPIVYLLTKEQWAHYAHTIGGPHPLYGYLVKEIDWVGTFQYSITSNGTYFVVMHNINWPAYGWIGPTINVSSYDAVKITVEKPPSPPPTPPKPVGGIATPINMPIINPELQIPWIWLTTVILLLVLTVVYVKKRKRNTRIISQTNNQRTS
jgi:hypothetical protein